MTTTAEKTRMIDRLTIERTVAESKGDTRRIKFLSKSIAKWVNRPTSD